MVYVSSSRCCGMVYDHDISLFFRLYLKKTNNSFLSYIHLWIRLVLMITDRQQNTTKGGARGVTVVAYIFNSNEQTQ